MADHGTFDAFFARHLNSLSSCLTVWPLMEDCFTRHFDRHVRRVQRTLRTLSEQLAHSAVDLRLKEISEFLHGSEMNKNPTLP